MSTPDAIAAAAEEHGWERVLNRRYYDSYRRKVTLPDDDPLAKMARAQGFELIEQVFVFFTSVYGVDRAQLHTPADQAAIDGHFVSRTATANGRGKKEQVMAWFARPPYTR